MAVIIVALGYLAYTGVQDARATTSHQGTEWHGQQRLQQALAGCRQRRTGSIKRQGTHIEFQLVEQDRTLPVVYAGTEAPPDTFKDNAQALAEGRFGRDGIFHATNLQAKCASKYAPSSQAPLRQDSLPRRQH